MDSGRTHMRIFYVISATLWSWIVGRCISFGPKSTGLCWHPHMHADTWYRLTHIPLKMPHQIITLLPIIIVVTSIPALYLKNDIVHAITVCINVSEHAFVPIFVAHIHTDKLMTCWSVVNVFMIAALIKAMDGHDLIAFCTTPKILLWVYLLYIQIYLLINGGVVTKVQAVGRIERTITV